MLKNVLCQLQQIGANERRLRTIYQVTDVYSSDALPSQVGEALGHNYFLLLSVTSSCNLRCSCQSAFGNTTYLARLRTANGPEKSCALGQAQENVFIPLHSR